VNKTFTVGKNFPMIGDRPMYYRLDGHEVVPASRDEFTAQFEDPTLRIVASDYLGEVHVSTVFLGLDHAFMGGPPLVFETMVFGLDDGEYHWRYHTWDEAVAGHARVLAAVRDGRDPYE
jgi:hypothetical protein